MTDEPGSVVFQCLDFIARDEFILNQTESGAVVAYDDHLGSDEEVHNPKRRFKAKPRWYDTKTPSPNDEKKGFQILLFGTTPEGKSICVELTGYRPYFYVQIPEDWTSKKKANLERYLRKCVHYTPEAQAHVSIKEEKHKKLFDFDNGAYHRFLRIEVPSIAIWRRMKDRLLGETSEPKPLPKEEGFNCELLKVYEANIDPVLRFFHERNLDPAGWMKIPPFKWDDMESDDATTAVKVSADWRYIEPDTSRLALAPLLIAAWDIECMSSHGDFPQPKKTWRKAARELLEANITDCRSAAKALQDALNAGALGIPSKSKVSPIFTKKGKRNVALLAAEIALKEARTNNMPTEDLVAKVETLRNRGPWSLSEITNEIPEPDVFEDMLDSHHLKYDERITNLDDFLSDKVFNGVEIKGDEVVQIGIVLYRNNKPESKHIFVLGTCDKEKVAPPSMSDVSIHVYPFDLESKLIQAFHNWLGKTDPDVMITYNGFGFDEKYLWQRAEELNCTQSCQAWSRLSTGKPRLIEKFLSSAAMGDNTMYIINSPGRLKVDMLPYVRRNYNLDSYTLDNVAATFMSGSLTGKVEIVEKDTFRVPTKSTKGAVIGRFIVLMDEENDHVLDKAEIVKVEDKAIVVKCVGGETKLSEHGLPPSRWAQVKDDVSPKELFALQRGSAADRAKIARYCLQDCDLVMELFMKLEVLNNAIAMANVCSVPVSFIFMRGQGVKIESLIFKECRIRDQLIEVLPAPKNSFGQKPAEPVIDDEEEEEKKPEDTRYEGAFVLDPVTGIYFDDDPVGVPDFSSLYPSTIISENLCHSSVVWVKDYKPDGSITTVEGSDTYDNLPGIGYVDVEYDILTNDPNDKRKHPSIIKAGKRIARFAQPPNDEKSTIPTILMKLLSSRKATRKKAEKETDEFRKALLDAAQLAYKLTANSLYGQLGSGTSKVRRVVLAASTTAYGRKQLIYAKELIETIYGGGKDPRCDAMAVYGDTDSLFIRWRPKDVSSGTRLSGDEAVALAKELTEEAGALVSSCLKDPHDFEFDKVFKTFCLLSKKRYVGDMSEGDLDHFHRKAMGIVMKRRDNAPIVKYVYGGVIENILTKQDIHAAFHFAQAACKSLVEGKFPISKLTITKSLRAEYATPNPPAHKILAERIGVRDPGNKPSTSERIPFVYIPAPPGSTLQGDRIETPTFIKEHNIIPDYVFYITNQISKPVAQVFGLVVEKLPGVTKDDMALIVVSKKPVEAREKLAERLLFGKIIDDVMKKRGANEIKQKQEAIRTARANFITQHKSS
jgi:DNA polymerase elongation subunit (family B)